LNKYLKCIVWRLGGAVRHIYIYIYSIYIYVVRRERVKRKQVKQDGSGFVELSINQRNNGEERYSSSSISTDSVSAISKRAKREQAITW
jgi:hypothetical protein